MVVDIFGVQFDFDISLARLSQTFAVLHYHAGFLWVGLGGLALSIYLLFTPLYFLILLYIAWRVYDFGTEERGGRRFAWLNRWALWNANGIRDYFPISFVKTAELPPDRNYIILYQPHGGLSIGAGLCFMSETLGFSSKFPGIRASLAALSIQFVLPFSREYGMAFG